MANQVKTYFLAPTWDYPPNGPISLGNIISSPRSPIPPLYAAAPGTFDPRALILSHKSSVEWTREKARSGKFGLYTKFAEQILGLGVDLSVEVELQRESTFKFGRIDTVEFWPGEEYLQERLKDPAIVRFLDRKKFKKEVFIIIGIKSVTGAKAKSGRATRVGGALDVGLDASMLTGAPVSFGPKIEPKKRDRQNVAWKESSDFVFAFRVLRLKAKRKGEVEEYNSGALYCADVEPGEEESGYEVVGLEEDTSEGREGVKVRDEEDEDVIVFPAKEDADD